MTEFFANPEAMILLTGLLLALAAALPGCYLVLRGTSLLTDAISHAVVFGIAVTWLVTGLVSGPLQVLGAAGSGLLTVLLIETLTKSGLIRQDAAMGLVFPTLFAAGVLIINIFARQIHLDVDTVLLGEIAFVWLDTSELFGVEIPLAVQTLAFCAALNSLYVMAFWKELKLATFDPDFAALQGMRPGAYFAGLLALTSVTAVAALDAVGAILFVAFIVVPPAAAFLLTQRLAIMVPLSAIIGMVSAFLGNEAAFALDISIGGMMALMTGLLFITTLIFAPRSDVISTLLQRVETRIDFATRTMILHLHAHQNSANMADENTAAALVDHLKWNRSKVERVILRGLDRDLITQKGRILTLTPLGQAMAQQGLAQFKPSDH